MADNNDVDKSMATSLSESKSQAKDETKTNTYRNAVSSYVGSLLDVANRNGGIGEKVSDFAKAQVSTSERVSEAMSQIQNRSGLKTFLIGSDYKNLGNLRKEIVQTRNDIEKLNRELESIATSADKVMVTDQIKALESEQAKLEDFVKTNEGKFSLFGWFVRMFNK